MDSDIDITAAFNEMLTVAGADITVGAVTKTKRVITGSIELARVAELAGDLPTLGTQATMLTSDFKTLGLDVRGKVTIAGIRMTILKVDKDTVGPMTDFVLINEK